MQIFIPNQDSIITHLMSQDDFNSNLTCQTINNPVIDNSVHSVMVTSITVINNHQDNNIIAVFMYVLADGQPAYILAP
jgi:hypothetical protein